MDWRLSQPGFDPSYGNLVCLASLMSTDRTKQICLWMIIYICVCQVRFELSGFLCLMAYQPSQDIECQSLPAEVSWKP